MYKQAYTKFTENSNQCIHLIAFCLVQMMQNLMCGKAVHSLFDEQMTKLINKQQQRKTQTNKYIEQIQIDQYMAVKQKNINILRPQADFIFLKLFNIWLISGVFYFTMPGFYLVFKNVWVVVISQIQTSDANSDLISETSDSVPCSFVFI